MNRARQERTPRLGALRGALAGQLDELVNVLATATTAPRVIQPEHRDQIIARGHTGLPAAADGPLGDLTADAGVHDSKKPSYAWRSRCGKRIEGDALGSAKPDSIRPVATLWRQPS